MSSNSQNAILVVGSSNMDLISYVETLPRPGETLRGTKFQTGFGGKGANQAVAAGKLGASVKMIVKIGTDSFGNQMKENFLEQGISEEHIIITSAAASGVAPIAVESSGMNNIIIIPGANDLLSPQEIRDHKSAFTGSKVLLTQLEIRLESTIEALKIGKQEGLTTILNTAPALHLPSEIYPFIDILCANETELEVLSGKKVDNVDAAIAASRDIIELGAKQVLITLGSKGCLLVTSDSTTYKAITKTVKAVDTTGAGDCFLGAFAYFLAQGSPIEICMERANVIAGYSVQKEGTQTSYPTRSELPSELFA